MSREQPQRRGTLTRLADWVLSRVGANLEPDPWKRSNGTYEAPAGYELLARATGLEI